MSWIGLSEFGFSSEELDKQQELITEPTTHQYLQPYLHNKTRKRTGKTNPQHNQTCKTKLYKPMLHALLVRQDTTGHVLTFSSIFVTGTCILSNCNTDISVKNFTELKTIPFMYFVLLV
jgi:hypothetical protein